MIRKSDLDLARRIDEILSHYRAWHFHPTEPPDFDNRETISAFVIEGSIWIHGAPQRLSVRRMIAPEMVYHVVSLDVIIETVVSDMAQAVLSQLLKRD